MKGPGLGNDLFRPRGAKAPARPPSPEPLPAGAGEGFGSVEKSLPQRLETRRDSGEGGFGGKCLHFSSKTEEVVLSVTTY